MRRFFVQNIFFLILVNLIVKPLWIFGIDRNVQLAVGHDAYGQYQALLNFSVIFQVLLDFGLQSYNNRAVAQAPHTLRTLFPNILVAKGILSAFYMTLIAVLGVALGYRGQAFYLLMILGLVQVLNSLVLYLRSNVSALHRFKTDGLLSVLDRLVMILICSVLLFRDTFAAHFRIEWFIYAQIVSYAITSLAGFIICARFDRIDWKHYDLLKVWVICRSSVPYAVLVFLMAIYMRSDMSLMERLLTNGTHEAGVYAAAYRLLDVANNVTGVLFAGMLLPMFGSMLARREPVQQLVRLSVDLIVPVAITALVTALFLGREIMMLQMKGMAGAYEGRLFTVLMFAFPAFCINYVYATLLTANGNLKPLIGVASVAVIINLGSNLVLMPHYGALGAAVTCCITMYFVAVTNIVLSQKIIRLQTDGRWLLRYLLFIILIGVSVKAMLLVPASLITHLAGIGLAAGLAMLLCGFVPFRKIVEVFRNK
ncbi:MATE family efflux transporter [Taibaiella koreensis]|uniref:polysaccharide biosynthesis C-terminal domain-containing protein n=1 Tax=Taibaiella koreensis TaxID=1268548 RepID=UPI000E59DD2C|nr:polysaccharide biosynthesis C-terminal domain-containing protein [Taibaiella koreensis]